MNRLETLVVQCPYCGESIGVIADLSVPSQQYVEDCSVCCNPIVMTVDISGEGEAHIEARAENE